jgi:two-component system, NtrC family, response regulator AtoC
VILWDSKRRSSITGYPSSEADEREVPRRSTRILVVNDDRAITSLLTTMLDQQGYQSAAAYSGEEAIQVARSFHPDFILSDVVMGAMNGIEAVQTILKLIPQCKVMFISGAGYIEALEKARSNGLNFEVIRKPICTAEMLSKISQMLSDDRSRAARAGL